MVVRWAGMGKACWRTTAADALDESPPERIVVPAEIHRAAQHHRRRVDGVHQASRTPMPSQVRQFHRSASRRQRIAALGFFGDHQGRQSASRRDPRLEAAGLRPAVEQLLRPASPGPSRCNKPPDAPAGRSRTCGRSGVLVDDDVPALAAVAVFAVDREVADDDAAADAGAQREHHDAVDTPARCRPRTRHRRRRWRRWQSDVGRPKASATQSRIGKLCQCGRLCGSRNMPRGMSIVPGVARVRRPQDRRP